MLTDPRITLFGCFQVTVLFHRLIQCFLICLNIDLCESLIHSVIVVWESVRQLLQNIERIDRKCLYKFAVKLTSVGNVLFKRNEY